MALQPSLEFRLQADGLHQVFQRAGNGRRDVLGEGVVAVVDPHRDGVQVFDRLDHLEELFLFLRDLLPPRHLREHRRGVQFFALRIDQRWGRFRQGDVVPPGEVGGLLCAAVGTKRVLHHVVLHDHLEQLHPHLVHRALHHGGPILRDVVQLAKDVPARRVPLPSFVGAPAHVLVRRRHYRTHSPHSLEVGPQLRVAFPELGHDLHQRLLS
ncbi:hypothetical protein BJ138DRAFT_1168210, partial [Hygrophoropsis aurantiaca]